MEPLGWVAGHGVPTRGCLLQLIAEAAASPRSRRRSAESMRLPAIEVVECAGGGAIRLRPLPADGTGEAGPATGATEDERVLVLPLVHASCCPMRRLDPMVANRVDLRLAVNVAVLAADGAMLITQRAPHMRTFPRVWVLPGGGVESGERLTTAAWRELSEETGLTQDDAATVDNPAGALRPLCIYESCYPPTIEVGVPKRHHAILIFTLRLRLPYREVSLKLQASEVAAAGWLLPRHIAAITALRGGMAATAVSQPPDDFPGVLGQRSHPFAPVLLGHLNLAKEADPERLGTAAAVVIDELIVQHRVSAM